MPNFVNTISHGRAMGQRSSGLTKGPCRPGAGIYQMWKYQSPARLPHGRDRGPVFTKFSLPPLMGGRYLPNLVNTPSHGRAMGQRSNALTKGPCRPGGRYLTNLVNTLPHGRDGGPVFTNFCKYHPTKPTLPPPPPWKGWGPVFTKFGRYPPIGGMGADIDLIW